ncbi:MAG: DNA-binding protein [Fretibacterium sp.]|nr:DNA-binding protein [Fretibacterium sp.]
MKDVQVSARETRKRTLVVRLGPGAGVASGIREVCEKYSVRSGAITTFLGSLSQVAFTWPVPCPEARAGLKYREPLVFPGPIEVLSGAGTIGVMAGSGEFALHLHAAFTDAEGRVWGGHLLDEGNVVAVTLELTLEAFEDACLTRATDEETGMMLFTL